MLIPAVCMTLITCFGTACNTISVEGATTKSINSVGTFHDNSYDGVPLDKMGTTKDDSKKNLIHDYKVVKGKVVDTVTGKTVKGLKVCSKNSKYFVGDNTTRIALSDNWDETIEAVIDYDEKKLSGDYPVFNTYIPSWIEPAANASFNLQFNNGVYNLKFERAAVDPYQSHYITVDSNFLRKDGMYVYEKLPKGDVFVAVATDYTNKKSYTRINGTATNVKLETKSDAYKYYRYALHEMVVTSNHKIKELKIYSGVRNAKQLKADYKRTGIASTVSQKATGTDGIVDLGCSIAWKTNASGTLVQQDFSNKKAGVYTIKDSKGKTKVIGIANYKAIPDKRVSNKGYKSVHITNKRKTIYVGKEYPLTAFPYPMKSTSGSNSDYDIVWSSSDKSVVTVIDGLIIAKKAGKAKITATLRGTKISDSFTIQVKKPPVVKKKVYNVPTNFRTSDGYRFSEKNYEGTLKAIFGAITYAKKKGYNYVVFPKMKFYASAYTTGLHYYVPSNMTIVFPKGSQLHMMYPKNLPNNVSASDETKCEFHIFEFGVPYNDYKNRCENSHLIIDKYYGERYEEYKAKGSVNEDKYIEEYRFVQFGRKAYNCSVQIRRANYAAGYFITADGTSSDVEGKDGIIRYCDMVKGRLNSKGKLVKNSYWISTKRLIKIPSKIKRDGYFMAAGQKENHYGRYWYWSNATACMYDIYWYNSKKKLIKADTWQGVGDYYSIPKDAVYYKISFNQRSLPKSQTGSPTTSAWMKMYDCGAAKDCEIKNTNLYHSATGLFSVVGETDGLFIHNNYVPANGEKPADARLGDFEDGWLAMRHSVVSNNVMDKGEYASGGYNNFMHTNFFGNEVYTKTCDVDGHIINNRGIAFLCADRYSINFYYNKVRAGSICFKDRPSMECTGNIHKNYNRYDLDY